MRARLSACAPVPSASTPVEPSTMRPAPDVLPMTSGTPQASRSLGRTANALLFSPGSDNAASRCDKRHARAPLRWRARRATSCVCIGCDGFGRLRESALSAGPPNDPGSPDRGRGRRHRREAAAPDPGQWTLRTYGAGQETAGASDTSGVFGFCAPHSMPMWPVCGACAGGPTDLPAAKLG
jgi:hypothetical protein